MGEDITETLEVIPRQWKVIQTVREKFTCRDCERISQPPFAIVLEPQAWLVDVLARMPDMPLSRLPKLLPWNWSRTLQRKVA